MIRVRICTNRCRCHNSCRRSRFSASGTQICGKLFSRNNRSRSRASSRSNFCFFTRLALISAGSPLHSSKPNSASSRSNQREYPVASMPTARRSLAASGLDKTYLLVHHCDLVPVHHTHLSLLQKMQSSESSGDNLRLSTSCSAPSPEPMVVKQPKFTRVEEPTLLCNQVVNRTLMHEGNQVRE